MKQTSSDQDPVSLSLLEEIAFVHTFCSEICKPFILPKNGSESRLKIVQNSGSQWLSRSYSSVECIIIARILLNPSFGNK